MKSIKEIMDFSRDPKDIINDLKVKFVNVPSWANLRKEYYPKEHPIYTSPKYLDNPEKGVELCRVSCGWQKLATKRMSELVFGIPCKRIWNADTDEKRKAVKVIEGIFKRNRIDAVNLDRAKKLYAGCEFATIWYSVKADAVYGGEKSRLKIRCKTYSPMEGDDIYPLFDDYDDLIALSVGYRRTVGQTTVEYFETWQADKHMRWVRKGSNAWEVDSDLSEIEMEGKIGKIAGVYAYRKEAIWEDESDNVYEAEWELSRNGNYIRKNSKPNWVVCADPEELRKMKKEKESDTLSRNVLHYPKDAKVGFETWNQSIESLKFQNEAIRRNFFMQLQLPDMSFESMKSTPMSGEARKMMFVDAELKVMDESGTWIEAISRECMVVKEFAKLAFASLSDAIDDLELDEVVITPYNIKDDKETTEMLSAACGKSVMSQRTAIEQLGWVDDVEEEMKRIQEEDAAGLEELAF